MIRSLTYEYNNLNTNRQEKQAIMGFETAKKPLNFVSKSLKGPVFVVKAASPGGTTHNFARVRFCPTVTWVPLNVCELGWYPFAGTVVLSYTHILLLS